MRLTSGAQGEGRSYSRACGGTRWVCGDAQVRVAGVRVGVGVGVAVRVRVRLGVRGSELHTEGGGRSVSPKPADKSRVSADAREQRGRADASVRAAEARVGRVCGKGAMRLGGDGVRISRKGIVRARAVLRDGVSPRRVRRGAHRAWRGDAQNGAKGAVVCGGMLPAGARAGRRRRAGGRGLGELCVGAPVGRKSATEGGSLQWNHSGRGSLQRKPEVCNGTGSLQRKCKPEGGLSSGHIPSTHGREVLAGRRRGSCRATQHAGHAGTKETARAPQLALSRFSSHCQRSRRTSVRRARFTRAGGRFIHS